jgi:hypothetical protein
MTTGPIAPVYAPSTVSPYQLFVDVVSGATLSIDDDDAFLKQSGYAMPAVTIGFHGTGSMGYDAGEVLGGIDTAEGGCMHGGSPYVYSPSYQSVPLEQKDLTTATVANADITRTVPNAQPNVTLVTPAPKKVLDATTTPTASPVTAPAALAPSSTFSVEVRGHHGRMQTVISHVSLEEGTHVVFEGDRGLDMGVVSSVQTASSKSASNSSIPMVVRSATSSEIHEWCEDLPALAAEAAQECAGVVQSMRLKMAIRGASYQLDKQKLTFLYETSEHRVDFRKLLIELFNRYRCRIWMEKYNNVESSVPRPRRTTQ